MSIDHSSVDHDRAAASGGRLAASSALLRPLLSASTVEGFMSERAPLAADLVAPPTSCVIVASTNGHSLTVADSDLRSQADEVQYGTHEGPRLDALPTGAVNGILDLGEETAWPRYRPHALRRHAGPGRGARPRPARGRDHRREGPRR